MVTIMGLLPKPPIHILFEPIRVATVQSLGRIGLASVLEDKSVAEDIRQGMVGINWKIVYDDPTFGIRSPGGCALAGGLRTTDEVGNSYAFVQPNGAVMSGDLIVNESRVLTLNKYGRMNGDPTAWDPARKAITGILQFDPGQNLGAFLAILTNPPKLPFSERAKIPVFPTRESSTFLPLSGLWKWSNIPLPFYTMSFRAFTASPEKRTLRLGMWDSGRNEVDAVRAELEGDTSYDVLTYLFNPYGDTEGFFEITPIDSRDGIEVESITMIPPPLE